jgi:hypothetical protein
VQVALILPQRRLGTWRERLAESISGTHDVKVFIDDGMPPYPSLIRVWLGIERLLYREQTGASSDFAGEDLSPSHEVDESKFDVIIDLTERPQPRHNAIAIRRSASASASISPTGTSSPLRSCSTTSVIAATGVVITGTPHAKPSRMIIGRFSMKVGSTRMSLRRRT